MFLLFASLPFYVSVSVNPTHSQVALEPTLLLQRPDRHQVASQRPAGLFSIVPHLKVFERFVAKLVKLVPACSRTPQL